MKLAAVALVLAIGACGGKKSNATTSPTPTMKATGGATYGGATYGGNAYGGSKYGAKH
jgi:hypothetical protein